MLICKWNVNCDGQNIRNIFQDCGIQCCIATNCGVKNNFHFFVKNMFRLRDIFIFLISEYTALHVVCYSGNYKTESFKTSSHLSEEVILWLKSVLLSLIGSLCTVQCLGVNWVEKQSCISAVLSGDGAVASASHCASGAPVAIAPQR